MIYIQKDKEPTSLTKYKKEPSAYFDGYVQKDDIRDSLLSEQGCLCAYCMRRIDKEHMKIEHWYPESRLTDEEGLDYRNMLGACLGHKEGQKGKLDTCDTHKGNETITVNPCDKKSLQEIRYESKSGKIYSDNQDIQKDLNHTLNLNSTGHRLPQNRKEKLDSVISELHRGLPRGTWSKAKLEHFIKEYSKPDSDGIKKEYLGIVLWYLNKKIR